MTTSTNDSPCIRRCCLDQNEICMGCFRSMDEIMKWTQVDDPERQQILDNAEKRRQDYYDKHPTAPRY